MPGNYKCGVCGLKYDTPEAVLTHLDDVHPDPTKPPVNPPHKGRKPPPDKKT